MKVIIISLIFIIPLNSFAQIPYTDFIQTDTAIQWAAEYDQILNITPKITRYGIRNILHSKLMMGECIDNYTTNGDGAFKSSFCLKDTGLKKSTFISDVNPYKAYYYHFSKICNETEITYSYLQDLVENKFQIYRVKQILYYKNNKLFINNTLVTSLHLNEVNDSNELAFSWIPTFTSCFNDMPTEVITTKRKKSFVDLGESFAKYRILNDITKESNIKIFTKLNPSFSHHLFEDILANKITIVDDKENIIPNRKVFEFNNSPVEVPVFNDEDGRFIKTKKMRNEVNIDSFYLFEIKQHFYYDSINNILQSEVKYIDLYKSVVTNQGLNLGDGFHFRIYFIKPSQYKRRSQKRFLN